MNHMHSVLTICPNVDYPATQGVGDRVRVRQVPRHVSGQRGDGRESLAVGAHRRAAPLLTQGRAPSNAFVALVTVQQKKLHAGTIFFLTLSTLILG